MTNLENKQAEYNKYVESIIINKKTILKSAWQIGLDLKEIKDRELYLLDCRDFKEFLSNKVRIGRSTAYFLLDIVKLYDWTDFEKWGFRKLVIIKNQFEDDKERTSFTKNEPVLPVRQLPGQLKEYQINKGLEDLQKETSRFEGQVGKPTGNKEETELKILRQWSVLETQIKSHLELNKTIISEIRAWKTLAYKHCKNMQINSHLGYADKYLKELE